MARERRENNSVEQELNLAPIMNMVVILIPLLLLSVVFLQVGVINITAPKLSIGPPSDAPPPDEEPLNLTVAISPKGFRIAATGANLPEMPGCPVPGPTVCLADPKVDVAQKFDEARKLMTSGSMQDGEARLDEALAAFNWKELYNQFIRIKKQYPDESIVNVTADPDVPYAAIVRVMDVARFQLEKETYSKDSEFWSATYAKKGNAYEELFPDPVLSIAQ